MTPRFDHIVVALEESKYLDVMKIEELQASLQAHELRLIDRNKEKSKDSTLYQALQAHYTKEREIQERKKLLEGLSFQKDEARSNKNIFFSLRNMDFITVKNGALCI